MLQRQGLTKGEMACLVKIETLGNEVITMPIEEICSATHYSHATVNRLIKKLGYKNIQEFRTAKLNEYSLASTNSEYMLQNTIRECVAMVISADEILFLKNELEHLRIGLELRGINTSAEIDSEKVQILVTNNLDNILLNPYINSIYIGCECIDNDSAKCIVSKEVTQVEEELIYSLDEVLRKK